MVSGKRKERNALKHRKNEPLADSAPGLAAPPPHLFRTPFRHAYAGLRTCRRHESLPSQYALPALTRLVRRSHHRRFISLPSLHRHRRPMLGRASDGTDRALRHLVATCYSSPTMWVRPWVEFTNGTRAANLAYLAFVLPRSMYSPFYQDAVSCRVRPSAVGNQSTPLAAPAGCVMKKPKKRPKGQPDWMWSRSPASGRRVHGRKRRRSRVLTSP